jgi:cobalt-zinc-cadmium efflux system membrane fusion protein
MASARANVEVKRRIARRSRELVDIRAAPEKDALAAEADLTRRSWSRAPRRQASSCGSPRGGQLFWVVAPGRAHRGSGTWWRVRRCNPRVTTRWCASPSSPRCWSSPTSRRATLRPARGGTGHHPDRAGSVTRPGTIDRISEVVDPKRRTVELRIRAAKREIAPSAPTPSWTSSSSPTRLEAGPASPPRRWSRTARARWCSSPGARGSWSGCRHSGPPAKWRGRAPRGPRARLPLREQGRDPPPQQLALEQ